MFEVNIRVLGGLLSAHLMYEEGVVVVDPGVDDYKGGLLLLAKDLANRLLRAFDTPTGIPFGSVNLRHGVHVRETSETATAAGGTFLLEFGVLSALTGDMRYAEAARRASQALFYFRSPLGLLGNHINITTGEWTQTVATVGTSVDSYLEYLFKAYVLFEEVEFLCMYRNLTSAVERYLRRGGWYLDVEMESGILNRPVANAPRIFLPRTPSLCRGVATVCVGHR